MANQNEQTTLQLTRRELLSRAACGAAVLSALPHSLKALASLPAAGAPSTRITEDFDFGWKFLKGDASGAEQPGYADTSWRDLDLPHDWSIEGPIDEHAPSGGPGGYMPTGIGWYRKRFTVPESYRGKVFVLEFDGVYENSDVWVNGQLLGHRPYGYIPFFYELTGKLNFGAENVVAVRVDNSEQTNCRWYSGSGIYRHTWMHVLNPVHVAQWGSFVTCPSIQANSATVEVRTAVANSRFTAARCKLMTAILDANGVAVASIETSQTIAPDGSTGFVQQITVPAPSLWSPANPYIYSAHSTLSDQEGATDEYSTPFGIREAVFDARRGFLLNGARLKLNGVCVHEAAGGVGAAVPIRVWARRLEILKEMGCNAIRTSHNPFAAEFLDLCDRMGFLVMAEAFDEWRVPKGQIRKGYSRYFDEWHERDLINFLHRDRNHPSIVLWSAGNEIGDQSAPDGADTLRGLLEIFHREDPTRPVTAACDRIASEPASNTVKPEFLAELDIVGYNYVDRWRDRAEKYYSIDHDAFPDRRVIGTESGGMSAIRGDYRSMFPSEDPADARRFLFRQNHNVNAELLWQFVSTYDYVAGDFMWTGIDYIGESFWPMRISASGVLDTCAFKKDGFYFYQSQWTQKPMLHLFPHWNWAGKEGQVVPVTCYTNCDTVELFVNGQSFGVKGYEFPRLGMEGTYGNYPARARALRTTADLHLSWDVPYAPGVLKAVGVKDGNIVTTVELRTTGTPASIALSSDRSTIAADRRDVAHLVVEIHDEKGLIVPVAANEITFAVDGDAKLISVDNGDPSSHDDFKASQCRAFNGLCLAIVQSTARRGAVRITATSPGLASASVTVNTGDVGS
jgi:beta-galactosidase